MWEKMAHPIRITLFVLSVTTGVATAQSTDDQHLPDGIQSPTAASLGKFGDIPVSLYTGVPNISIPLHQIAGSKLSLPLQLNYHASGVKVREIAGWVGLGWALDAGGVITRTVRGLVDEAPYGYLETQDSLKAVWEGRSTTLRLLLKVEDQGVDPEPDMFFYNFSGRSGKFVLSTENMTSTTIQGKPISDTNIDIKMIQTTGCGVNGDCTFKITVEDGTKYIFEEREIMSEEAGGLNMYRANGYTSSWYLTRIESAMGTEMIQLNYGVDEGYYKIKQNLSGTAIQKINCYYYHEESVFNESGMMYPFYFIFKKRPYLTSIQTQKETIGFTSDTLRDDPGRRRLTGISVHRNAVFEKGFDLTYGYNNAGASQASERRLLLKNVRETGGNGVQKPPYEFIYDSTALPDRLSYEIDYWGYYNGPDGADPETLIPHYKTLPGADREPAFPDMQAGSLKKIVYPTGGSTELVYEQHTYNWIGDRELPDHIYYPSLSAAAYASPGALYDVDTFMLQEEQEVEINYFLDCQETQICENESTYLVLKNGQQELQRYTVPDEQLSTYGTDFIFLNPGDYSIEAHGVEFINSSQDTAQTYAQIEVAYTDTAVTEPANRKTPAGGLRVAKIMDKPATNGSPVIRKFEYVMPDDSLKSSGVLVSNPAHYFNGYVDIIYDRYLDKIVGSDCLIEYRSSNSTIQLGSTHGSPIGYQFVSTIFGENGEGGKTISQFVSPREWPDIYSVGNPFKPGGRTSTEWRRGHRIQQKVLDQSGKQLVNSNTEFKYIKIPNSQSTTIPAYPAFTHTKFVHPRPETNEGLTQPFELFLTSFIRVDRGIPFKTVESERSFDPDNPLVFSEDSTLYLYHEDPSNLSFGQLRKTVETNSDGTQRITDYTYAHEVSDDGRGLDYTPMKALNMLSQPYSVMVSDSAGNVLSKRWTLWSDSTGFWRPQSEWIWTGGNPFGPVFDNNN